MTAEELLRIVQKNGAARTSSSGMATKSPLAEYGLDNVDCPLCNNTGQILYDKDGYQYSRDCECMSRRKALRNIERSGLGKILEKYQLENYKPDTPETTVLLKAAKEFLKADSYWLYICGRPGSGKTHLCTGICANLINMGRTVLYMLWRDDVVRLKVSLTSHDDDYYQKRMNELKNVSVLYIDDFLKGSITPSDVQIAFELINYRYCNPNLQTLISSEVSMKKLVEIDEALARRIYERCGHFCLTSPNMNRSFEFT